MQRLTLFWVVVALCLPAMAFAQPPQDPDLATFTSQDGLYSIEYPSEWRVVVPSGSGSLLVTNLDENGLLRYFTQSELDAADYVLYMEPYSPDLFSFAVEAEVTPDTPPEDLLMLASSIYFPTDTGSMSDEAYEIGEIQTLDIGAGNPIAVAPLSNSQINGWLILFRTAEDVIIMARALTGPDTDFTPYEVLTVDMLNSLTLSPDLIPAIEAGDADDAEPDAAESDATPAPVATEDADN